MALIECPDCKRSVSDRAFDCPGCGYPLNQRQDLPADPLEQLARAQRQRTLTYALPQQRQSRVQTIEKTSKVLKAQLLMATIVLVGGLVWGLESPRQDLRLIGALIGTTGGLWYLTIRVAIWWNHG